MFGPKTQATIALIAAAIIGAAAGATVEHMRAGPDRKLSVDGGRPGGEGRRGNRGPHPFEQLDLNEAQREQIQSIMESYKPRTETILQEMIPRIRAIRDSARIEIDGILTEEQRATLEEMDNFWGRGRPGRFRGGPPPFVGDSAGIESDHQP